MTERDKYCGGIRLRLQTRDILEAVAEEASEISKAALKVIRANGLSENVTPVSTRDADLNLEEEIMDLLCVLDVYGFDLQSLADKVKEYWKWERWAERLGTKHDI